MVIIAYAQKPTINAHNDVFSSRARGLNISLRLHLYPYSMFASSEGSGESAQIAFAQTGLSLRLSTMRLLS